MQSSWFRRVCAERAPFRQRNGVISAVSSTCETVWPWHLTVRRSLTRLACRAAGLGPHARPGRLGEAHPAGRGDQARARRLGTSALSRGHVPHPSDPVGVGHPHPVRDDRRRHRQHRRGGAGNHIEVGLWPSALVVRVHPRARCARRGDHRGDTERRCDGEQRIPVLAWPFNSRGTS